MQAAGAQGAAASLSPITHSLNRRPTFVEAKHRSDRQQVNPITCPLHAQRAEPTTTNEWGLAERFVSGAAAWSAASPFVDVQSVPRCVAAVQNTGLEMGNDPKGQVLLLKLETVGSPCRLVRPQPEVQRHASTPGLHHDHDRHARRRRAVFDRPPLCGTFVDPGLGLPSL
jgi:hypothetical protein